MQPSVETRMTLDEYLAFEATSPVAHEYRDGCAVALAVPTGAHATIAMNLALEIAPAARAAGCEAFAGDVKIVSPRGERLIPDIVVTCDAGDLQALRGSGEATISRPWLVIEILSATTAADDMTSKLDVYQSIAEITHYVVVDSWRRAMRVFERSADSGFSSRGPLALLDLPRLGRPPIPLDVVYRGTDVVAIGATG